MNELLLGQHVVSEVVLYIGVLISNIVLCYRQGVCFIMLCISFCFSVFFSSHRLSLFINHYRSSLQSVVFCRGLLGLLQVSFICS